MRGPVIILSEHGPGLKFDKDQIAQNFTLLNGTHPVVYASRNGHANFPGVRDNFTESRKFGPLIGQLTFHLLNTTADGGKSLDCS